MPRKKMTPEEKQAFGEKMRLAREAKKKAEENAPVLPGPSDEVETQETDLQALQRQINEVMESNALLKAALLQKQDVAQSTQTHTSDTSQPQVNQQGKMIGQFEKYSLSEDQYPSPIERLAKEPRLAPLAFEYNYHMTYAFTTRQYDTKQGINTIEPEFEVNLWKNVLDDDGKVVKRYRARKLIFHEDPQAAMTIAHDNNILIDKEDERNFLNEMRYLRVRDWLFDIFWPRPAQAASQIREEVIGNQLVEVVTVNSEDSEDLSSQMDSLKSKLRA